VAEQQPADWWVATQECVQELLAQDGVDASGIAAISLSGQMQDVILASLSSRLRTCLHTHFYFRNRSMPSARQDML